MRRSKIKADYVPRSPFPRAAIASEVIFREDLMDREELLRLEKRTQKRDSMDF
jgi:hypothetical protein